MSHTVRIEIDEREGSLFDHIQKISATESSHPVLVTKKVLPLGDALIYLDDATTSSEHPIVIIERKSFQDLFASIKDGRYQEQSYRLIHSGLAPHVHNIIYLIEGSVALLKSEKERSLLYSTAVSLNLYKGFSLYRTTHIQESADFIYSMATKILRNALQRKEFPLYMILHRGGSESFAMDSTEQDTTAPPPSPPEMSAPMVAYSSVVKVEKKENITPENIGTILLCQIPGIQHITAEQIMKRFKTVRNLIESLIRDPKCMDQFYMTTTTGSQRKLSQAIIQNIKKFLVDDIATI